MSKALVTHVFFNRTHFLKRNPDEWTPDQAEAAQFDPFVAQKYAEALGGTVVLLDQRRTVDGELGVGDGGRKF